MLQRGWRSPAVEHDAMQFHMRKRIMDRRTDGSNLLQVAEGAFLTLIDGYQPQDGA